MWLHDNKTGTNLNVYDTWHEVKTAHADKKTSVKKEEFMSKQTLEDSSWLSSM